MSIVVRVTPAAIAGTSHVIHAVKNDLLSGELHPGQPLRLATLADHYGSSVSAVREALLRLAEQHLVTSTPNAGFRVRDVSREDLEDLTDLRVLVETAAIRRAVELGNAEWESAVVGSFHLLDRIDPRELSDKGASEEWTDAHSRFHHTLISACGRPRMMAMADALRDGAELYRQLSAEPSASSGRNVREEHRQLRDAAVGRDPQLAAELLEAHLRTTTNLIVSALPSSVR